MRFESGHFLKATSERGKKKKKKRVRWKKMQSLNIKYNAPVFLPISAKGTSDVTQNAQFILRGLMENHRT